MRYATKKFADAVENLRPLLSCPFCGSGNAFIEMGVEGGPGTVRYAAHAVCTECGAEGPYFDLPEPMQAAFEAAKAWNTRAISPPRFELASNKDTPQ